MTEVVRADALHRQVANIIREAIDAGEYPPGTLLPSESVLGERHGVSRATVRLALNTLRSEGLITVKMGRGSTVRPGPEAKTVTAWRTADIGADRITDTSEPDQYRSTVGDRLADLLNLDADEPTFVQVVNGTDPDTGQKVITRRILPFSTTTNTILETDPFQDRVTLLAILAEAHKRLVVTEYVRPLMPTPDEVTALGLIDGTPILETTRITSVGRKGLLAEIERTGGDGIQHAYHLTH